MRPGYNDTNYTARKSTYNEKKFNYVVSLITTKPFPLQVFFVRIVLQVWLNFRDVFSVPYIRFKIGKKKCVIATHFTWPTCATSEWS